MRQRIYRRFNFAEITSTNTGHEPFTSTVIGSYRRNTSVSDTMKKTSLSRGEVDDLIRWAARDQADLDLEIVTDGEGYRENMYYFYQKRLDGVTFKIW